MTDLCAQVRFFYVSFICILPSVHTFVHDFEMKQPFSEPKIYTGGVDVKRWSRYSAKEKKEALAKEGYVCFSYRSHHQKTRSTAQYQGWC